MNALPDWITPEWQKENGYISLRALDDGSVIGLFPLLYTLAIIMDIEPLGYRRRFCFEDRDQALSEFARLESGDDEPVGYIARR
ncbi:hypothetical protein [Methyloversatilis sp.]|uniref:hypothetical protein n=1 Tax=Methyloversatilis sp. TaxID=2569862 RepID=UPI0035B45E50